MHSDSKISVRFISLGCPKNLVDSELMLGGLQKDLFTVLPPDQSSDVGIVNTCGFIEDSKQESINTILELAEEKKKGRLKLLLVAGCLPSRYPKDLLTLLPEVDAFLGASDFSKLPDIIRSKLEGEKIRDYIRDPQELMTWSTPRAYATPFYTRYVKISEGCSHTCSFCSIPIMRGGLRSRKVDDIKAEMDQGIREGVKEFNLIAQDLNEYGRDLADRDSLFNLLTKLGECQGDIWIRLLYMYPLQFPDKLVSLIKDHPHICPYVDIPLQHIDDAMLRSMNRGSSSKYIHRLIGNLKKDIPGIILRTTFIAGYPGETDEAFQKLHDFIEEMEFDRLGVFTYSEEEGTPAAGLPNQVPVQVRQDRKDALMRLQQRISEKKNKAYVGKVLKVLCENPAAAKEDDVDWDHVNGVGRFYGQAPGIDGLVLIEKGLVKPGEFVDVKITKALDYDLVGEII